MPTITIKDIPEELHAALKTRATANSRSLNKEILRCLEASIAVSRVDVDHQLAEIDRVRADGARLDPGILRAAIDEGRP